MALRLAAFDLDGTLLRGQTACEAIAKRIERMRELERLESTDIEEMAEWYSDFTFSDLCNHLAAVRVAPGIDEVIGVNYFCRCASIIFAGRPPVEDAVGLHRSDSWGRRTPG